MGPRGHPRRGVQPPEGKNSCRALKLGALRPGPGGGGLCAGQGTLPGAGAALTALALLWPRRRWRSCTRCSCCSYQSRPRAIISRPCCSTSCSCSSSSTCFSCHTGRTPSKRAQCTPAHGARSHSDATQHTQSARVSPRVSLRCEHTSQGSWPPAELRRLPQVSTPLFRVGLMQQAGARVVLRRGSSRLHSPSRQPSP